MIYDAWDIVVVPFPFMERPASKRRPALVLSASTFNANNHHTALAMITTAAGERWADDFEFTHAQDYGLARSCYLRWKLFTLPNHMIERKLGMVTGEELAALKEKARTIFARA